MRCLGLDIGSSSIKGAVLDTETASVSHIVREPFPDPVPGLPSGFHEVAPDEIFARAVRVIDHLTALAPDATTLVALLRLSFSTTDTTPRIREADLAVVRAEEGSILKVRIRAPVSARVEVAGTFSGWDPLPLTLKDGYWEAEVRVPPGRHRVAYRIDGGPWRAPTQLAKLREFGGEVGLLIVP